MSADRTKSRREWRAPLLALTSAVSVAAVGFTLALAEGERVRDAMREEARTEAAIVRHRFEHAFDTRVGLLRELAVFARRGGTPDGVEFFRFAKALTDREAGILSLQLAPASILRFVYPPKRLEDFPIGKNLFVEIGGADAFRRALESASLLVESPFARVKDPLEVVVAMPIVLDRLSRQGLWGAGVISFNLLDVIEESGITSRFRGMQLAIGKHRGEILYGDFTILDQNPVIETINVSGSRWYVAAVPVGGWVRMPPSSVWIRGIANLIALLVGVAVWRLVSEPARLQREIERATESIRTSEERFRNLLEAAPDAMVICDQNNIIRLVNAETERLFLTTREALVGESVEILGIYSRFAERVEQYSRIQSSLEDELDLHAKRSDGSEFPVDIRMGPLDTGDDGPLMTVSLRNIAERRAAEEERQRLAALVENSNELILIGSYGERLVYLNPAGARLLGIDAEHPWNSPWVELFNEPDRERFRDEILPGLLNGQSWSGELTLRHPRTGATVPLEGRPFLLHEHMTGEPVAIGLIAQNVSEKNQTLATLHRLERAVAQSNDGIAVAEPNGTIVFGNQAFADMHGIPLGEVVGANMRDFHTPQQASRELLPVLEQAAQRGASQAEVGRMRRDGSTFPASLSITQLSDDTGQSQGFVVISRDITDKKREEEALRAALHLAEAGQRARDSILQNVGHEVRTPLNVLMANSEMLIEHLHDNGDTSQDALVGEIESSAKRLLTTMQGVLDLSKLESSIERIEHLPIDLVRLLADVAEPFEVAAASKGIGLVLDLGEQAVTLGDDASLRSGFERIVDNAVKFTESGEVRISIGHEADSTVVVSIADTGIGIAEDFVDRVFEPFAQEDDSAARRFEGAGVGLAVAIRQLGRNDARVEVSSTKGAGTVVRVRLRDARRGLG